MRKFQKKQLLEIMSNLHTLHQDCKEHMERKAYEAVCNILVDCQDFAIQIGEAIDKIEGNGTVAVTHLEHYCENIYQINARYKTILPQKAYKSLEESLAKAELAVVHMTEKIEAVFLPYKASMWDSLESVWQAAEADPNCDAYVIPIPYYDKNADGSFGKEHYEGDQYPAYVPITNYNDYNYEGRHPDVIFIHNPYDQYNNVTSIHPFFYSKNLKKFTDLLVYIPYYSTSGGMSEGQRQCIAYYYADYIVIQSEKYRKFFESDIPDEKFLAFGSPKFDKVVKICKNPPEPPEAWKEKIAGKKVYFYNTSIAGMLGNTAAFLKKMEYVFRCFANREDVCLLWRPHPLLESTFDSMRPKYRPIYDALKRYFLESDFGVYDDTADMMNAIALSDVYIGDAGTSVVSLFGIMGKPVFILNNYIDSEPGEDDWKGEVIRGIYLYGDNKWMITQGNKLYHSINDGYQYRYCCDLSGYSSGNFYSSVVDIGGSAYVCPANAQNILVVNDGKIEKKIELKQYIGLKGAFYGAIACGNYLFLIPSHYPAIVRYDTVSGKVKYLEEHLDIFTGMIQGEWRIGGFCVHNGYIFLASPQDNRLLAVHAETGEERVLTTNAKNTCGCFRLSSDGTDLWLLPYSGNVITRWNPESGAVHEYADYPEGFRCQNVVLGYECKEKAFNSAAFYGDYVFLPPFWANMYIKLDKRNGKMTEWQPPFEQPLICKNGYFFSGGRAVFVRTHRDTEDAAYCLYSALDRKLYDINFKTSECK
ncbi:MAG: hypothetical protein K2P65_08480, partial [Lachnospiraceae bacterium]|nr:hypothetical protein [Lachnospiraceae bacterium]